MLEAAAHCDVLLPPEFVIELHSAGLVQFQLSSFSCFSPLLLGQVYLVYILQSMV